MPYIGRGIVSGNFTKLDSITTSATATYALTNGGAAFTPQSVNQMIVSLNGVIQAPTDAFTISGSNIVFDSALTSSDVIDFILVLGDVNDIGVPSDDSISAVKLKSSSVTNKKLADQSFEKGAYGSSSNPITYTVKVISKTAAHPYYGTGSSQGYEIDGVEAPVLKLNGSDAGKKYYYKFDQSDSSNSGHPLLFYLKADKTGAYTTNVTATGTPGNAGAFTTIQVDEYTPNILYYQCSSHAHMGNHVNHISNQVNTSGTLLKLPTADGSSGQFIKTDGSGVLSFAAAGGGKVLQAVTGTSSTASQGTETSFTDTGLNVTITPSATSSKILVMAHTTGLIDTNDSFVYFTIERQISGGSDTNIGDSSIGLSHMRGDTVNISNVMVHALDSPSTTSAITYEFQRRVSADSGAAMYQNVKSNITVLEIGA